jgi:response regulator RpfG family c-di-GMP phosphodiesterase
MITDLDFPTLSGVDLTHHVRTNYPATHVIVMIPLGDVRGGVQAIRGGASDYLMKPFSADEFVHQLKEWSQGQGMFSRWARSQTDGLPERRTFREALEIWTSVRQNSFGQKNGTVRLPGWSSFRHPAIVADAVRTLHQIIDRDIEEVALFAAIDEEELVAAFVASLNTGHSASQVASFYNGDAPNVPEGRAEHA